MSESDSLDTQVAEFEVFAQNPPKPMSEETRQFLRRWRQQMRDDGLLPPEQPTPPKKDEPPSAELNQPN